MKISKTIQTVVPASIVAMALTDTGIAQAEAVNLHPRGEVNLGVTDLSFHRATGAVVANILDRRGFKVTRSFFRIKRISNVYVEER